MLNKIFNKKTLLVGLFILGFVVRLYKIDNPIADWHSWRQADTAAVTRNFFKMGIDLLHPKYEDLSDVSGRGVNLQGYRFVEFPIFNLIHYALTAAFPGKSLEYWGRMVSILASLVSAYLIYLIVENRIDDKTAILAAGLYLLTPYNIYFTRVILPDPLMVTFYLAALYTHYHKHKNLTILFGALAILIKPVAIFFLLPIYISNIWWGLLMLLPFGAWRAWSFLYSEGVPASLWLLNGDGIRFKGAFFQWIFGDRLGSMILGKWGVFPFVMGLSAPTGFLTWILGAAAYLFTFATGNVHHDYYQIPIIPIVCILVAIGARNFAKDLPKKIILVSCLVLMVALGWYKVRGDYQINNWSIVHAGQEADKILPKDAIVVAPYNGDTAFLYQTNRQGFAFLPLPIEQMIKDYHVNYYVSVNYDDQTNAIIKKYQVIERNSEFVIVKL